MNQWIFLILGLIGGYIVVSLIRSKKRTTSDDPQLFKLLADEMKDIRRTLDERLHQSSEKMYESLKYQSKESIDAIKDVTERLVRLDETNKQVVNFTDQLQQLQNMLKNPKGRGILGEYYLETVLKNVLPPRSYQMQYGFPNGDIVDAVVFVKGKVIPIDSKFSLENYNRMIEVQDQGLHEQYEREFKADLKRRIDETSKYIQPDNGTMDFAFMFIPHEAIYYDLLVAEVGGIKINTHDLIEYAFKKNVLIVSPTSFLAFLQTVLQGLKALQIEESAKEIQKRVGELGNHLKAFAEYHDKMGKSLGTVVNQYNLSNKEFKKIDKDVLRINGEAINIEVLEIDKPHEDS
jgi:DNA recombination protein RmuC